MRIVSWFAGGAGQYPKTARLLRMNMMAVREPNGKAE
jgi:hypothetical protein